MGRVWRGVRALFCAQPAHTLISHFCEGAGGGALKVISLHEYEIVIELPLGNISGSVGGWGGVNTINNGGI